MGLDFDRYTPLLQDGGRMLLLVVDGLGGFPEADRGSELEDAHTPNLDALAASGITGLTEPAGPGITVGSGPGHLALFGFDPWRYDLGRGVLSAVGVSFDMKPGDVATRGNLAFLDDDGNITDRRAGRIPDEQARPVVEKLRERVALDDVEVFFEPESEHRVVVILRGEGLDGRIDDMDPQEVGVPPLPAKPQDPAAQHTADVLDRLDAAIREALHDQTPDALLMRGFDSLRDMPDFTDRTGMRACAIASYPMYRGVAQLIGFDVLGPPTTMREQIDLVAQHREDYDYHFVHFKYADAAGHDGNREAKVEALENLDADIPALLEAAEANVVAVTGDHASPASAFGHSWHPVPTLLAGGSAGVDDVTTFGERACAGGLFGLRPTQHLLPLMMAAAGRFAKYGA
ncbi:2,3-bisphosphoglycerate-independent phosphoglycerate mutase [Euzebya tangerina]|uniref:2,3-bisphosphoglycerate-independent phosphoglycerate mutase n=1 Tax=Euzebya tangerina TaxID=591198 RepID=UPI000E320023|nr:2,3-bisphosphoglycerate-independent phosphoglycerate mutase [Euzebya tangerina]